MTSSGGSWSSMIGSYASSGTNYVGDMAKSVWNSEKPGLPTAQSYANSAANYVGDTAKQVWNSETLAAGESAVRSYAGSAANFVGETAKNCYNSEAVASGAQAAREYAGSAVTYVGESAKNVWNATMRTETKVSEPPVYQIWTETESFGPKNAEGNSVGQEQIGDAYRGAVFAMSKNAANFVVKTAGRSSNIVNIYDKTRISSLGNPKWWVRFDRPHGNVDYNHININKAVTGLKDPHLRISPTTANAAGYMGKVAETANDVAPYLMTATMIFETYLLVKQIQKDCEHGTTRNSIQHVSTVTGKYLIGGLGASTGAAVGSFVLPGLGTIFGGLLGGFCAAAYGGHYSGAAADKVLDHVKWDTVQLTCARCNKSYTWNKFEREEEEKDGSPPGKKKNKKQQNWLKEDPAGKAVHISAAGAQVAESASAIGPQGLATIGQAAPVLQVAAVAYDAYQIGRNVEKDRRRGTTRNTVKKVTTTFATYSAGIGGAFAGAAIGTAIFPGVGTIVGGIVGGLTGGIGGGIGSGKAAEVIMDRAEYDSVRVKCDTCHRTFLCRKYQADDENICGDCQEN